MSRDFDVNNPWSKHITAAILTAGYANVLIKKKPENTHISDVVDLYWDLFECLKPPRK